jgi:hypothetical protein
MDRRLFLTFAMVAAGCFPEFRDWNSGGTADGGGDGAADEGGTAMVGGGGATSNGGGGGISNGGSGGVVPLACADARGACQPAAPSGWQGPALMSDSCATAPSLRAGTALRTSQPDCSYTALAADCGAATITFHSDGSCSAPSQVSTYVTAAQGECDLSPSIPDGSVATAYRVAAGAVAPCALPTPPPFPSYDGAQAFCEQEGICDAGETCAPVGVGQICIWSTSEQLECPTPYIGGPTHLVTGTSTCPSASAAPIGVCDGTLHLGPSAACNPVVEDISLDDGCTAYLSGAVDVSALVEIKSANGCAGAASAAAPSGDVYVCCLGSDGWL